MELLYEKHRPKEFGQVVGQAKAVQTIQTVLNRGWGGRAFWLSGQTGTGKTTLARLIAAEGANPEFVQEMDADEVTPGRLREICDDLEYSAWGLGGRAIIVNEAHGLRKDTIRILLVALERIPDHAVWIFTTTKEGEKDLFDEQIDASPLMSRCFPIALTNQGLAKAFAELVQGIAQSENLDGQPLESYIKLAQKCKNNCRAMLQAVEAGAMIGGAA